MPAPVSISVIAPTRNRRDVLGRLLLSVLAQGRDDVEIIIVDDASEMPVDAAGLRETVQDGNLPVYVMRLPEARGACAARNAGAAAAAGSLLLFVDDDIEFVGRDLFSRLLRFTSENPSVGVVALAELDPQGKWGFNLGPPGNVIEVARFHGCGAAFRRECFEQAGRFLEPLGYYYEEFELSMRVINEKWHIVFHPDFLIVHYRDPRGRDVRINRRLISRNALLTGFARFPLWMLPAATFVQLARFTKVCWARTPKDPFGVWAVVTGTLKQFPSVIKERRVVSPESLRRYKMLARQPLSWPNVQTSK